MKTTPTSAASATPSVSATLATSLAQLAVVLAGAFCTTMIAHSAVTDIYNEPLAQAAANTKPNLMFILDDSGSMAWDYTPDWVPGNNCLDAMDSSNNITGSANSCRVGDPPYMSPDINTQYYNPEIYYRPGANYDGTDRTSQTSANTTGWTLVRTDSFNTQNKDQFGNTTNYVDITTNYPDRVWCNATATSAFDTNLCLTNASYSFPSVSFGYGLDGSGNRKYRYAEPYYYRVDISEICSDDQLTTCIAGTTPTVTHPYAARVRWCTSTAYTDCQKKHIGSYTNAKYLGATTTGTIPDRLASGTITIGNSGSNTATDITSVQINGVTVTNATINASGGTNTSAERDAMATALALNITTATSTPEYTATALDNVVTITAVTPVAPATYISPNGFSVQVNSTTTGTTAASFNFSVSSTSNTSTGSWIQNLKVASGTVTLANAVYCDYSNSTTNRRQCAYNIAQAINAGTGTHGYSATPTSNNSTTTVTVSAPLSQGAAANTRSWAILNGSGGGGALSLSATSGTFSGGISSGNTPVTIVNMGGGANTFTGTIRTGVGSFTRTTIKPSITTYPKGSARVDCAALATCTYDEEMTNFANWFTYYRTRMQMMKSAAGRAFVPIDDTYRVGFITINPGYPVDSSRYLKINDFTSGATGHKEAWYTKFYGTGFNGGTPLREALSRVGQIYAGKFTTNSSGGTISGAPNYLTKGIYNTDDPVQHSCQPNFAILSTDGYWTTANSAYDSADNHGWKENMSDMDNVDNVNSGWSKRSDGVYDGNRNSTIASTSSGASGTLADVALYYYKNDLRPAGSLNAAGVNVSSDNVPQSQKDIATHQHMVTFTLGLGLDGNLSYRSDYDDPSLTSGDFYRIKTGAATCASNGGGTGTTTCDWPSVTQDSETALDDLWHAAVNGRGLFFSAKNPEELSRNLGDTLAAMRARVGAGAAAATSNLQPVAGDNYAFTAQYQTQTWTGDISARTIDPATAIVSTNNLWTAAILLDARADTSRVIFTSDLTDTTVSAAVGSGNKLKHFCWPSGTPITVCEDGVGLTATEQGYFAQQLVQYTSWLQLQKDATSGEKVVNFVRGDNSNESLGTTTATDLYRNRASIMGDIINAQPAFIKASTFTYNDTGYSAFKACTAGTGSSCPSAQFPAPTAPRRATVYIASNDGFLHAFEVDANNNPYYQTAGISTATTTDDTFTGNNTGNGQERWAFTPNLVLPDLYKLANDPYAHRYSTDGSPVIADVCTSTPCAGLNDWRTILVAGLNSGGRGYYALDITNPLAPKALWEFGVGDSTCQTSANIISSPGVYTSDCHVGLTYGNPIITKRKSDGKWIVIVSSGYNNVNPGDGKGYLYVLDAMNGTILHRIGTGVGCDGVSAVAPCTSGAAGIDPSGLGRINSYIDNALVDNITLTVYGGDLKGNVWRFDLDSANTSTYLTAFKLTTLVDSLGVYQPVTVKPELGTAYNYRVVMLGTGKFLGTSDKADTQTQTIYALRDDLTAVPISGRSQLTSQTLSAIASAVRTITTSNSVDWTAKKGWYIDLPETSERVNVDPQLQKGTLIVPSNVPNTDTCSAGGFGLLNFLDYKTGQAIATSAGGVATYQYTGGLIVGVNYAITTGGDSKAIVTGSDTNLRTFDAPTATSVFSGNRISWRELIYDR